MKNVIERMEENQSAKKIADFHVKQQQPYQFKRDYAEIRAQEFYSHPEINGNCYVAVGGLDSITLYLFLHSIGIKVPAVSVSFLEDKSIQKVHRALGVVCLKPALREDDTRWTKARVIKECGFPVLSKEIANKIALLQHPSEKNATVRHAIITGETGAYGGYRKGTRMKLAKKWLEKFGGYENEREGTNYGIPDFLVSDKCCYYLKEKPCDDYARETGLFPYMGLMASEGGRRQKALMLNGCNYISKGTKRSAPFAIFQRQDVLELALEMDKYYLAHRAEFNPDPSQWVDTIVPAIYGEIVRDPVRMDLTETLEYVERYGALPVGQLRTTKAQRTGCSMCGFGIHLEKRPHRFDRLRQENPREWEYQMYHIGVDINGNEIGWGHVLDYIGVGWQDDPFEQEVKPEGWL